MTKFEAIEKATQLWGPDVWVGRPLRLTPPTPGRPEWWVEASDRGHALDVNGHPVCHRACAQKEAQA